MPLNKVIVNNEKSVTIFNVSPFSAEVTEIGCQRRQYIDCMVSIAPNKFRWAHDIHGDLV